MSLFRTAISRVSATSSVRAFHASPAAFKTVTEKVSEVAENVNKKLGQGLASAIEKGEDATSSTKESLRSAADKTKEGATVAKQKANQASAGATEAKEDFKKEVKK
ncbi:f1 atpase assembly protein 11 [Lentinula edodes]|uniref:F1 atpase assembly protein 11 n=1 Tax=Lentinula edodes TaxID=5353 RepID=A0A1Q3EMD8_LENED|nr:hypothetical protein F5877DRAFT_74593 [Lentinula edodes]GAW08346.1 f1 atpase assembly protein 11 [Lentinula edodes]